MLTEDREREEDSEFPPYLGFKAHFRPVIKLIPAEERL